MNLEIKNLHVEVEGKEIIKGVTLIVKSGEVHALMGPNGSGKSTLAYALMGHPKYKITSGKIMLNGEDITHCTPDVRSQKGLFLSFQHPKEIAGVSTSNFLKIAKQAHQTEKINVVEFHKELKEKMSHLGIEPSFSKRSLNEGFSGGERKRAEILQMSILAPKFAILDETDSGLDVDSLKIVCEGINKAKTKDLCIILITHYTRILKYITPDIVHIFKDGNIQKTGKAKLAHDIEEQGYEQVLNS